MISAGKESNKDVIYLRLLSNSWIKTVGTDIMYFFFGGGGFLFGLINY